MRAKLVKLDSSAPVLARYTNGNYNVTMYADGTKTREGEEDVFMPKFPENIDVKITNSCTGVGCPFCFEGSIPGGKHASLSVEEHPWLMTLRPGTELAIGGGNVLEHPELDNFLQFLKERKVIANITVNSVHFLGAFDRISKLMADKLIWGLGLSYTGALNDKWDLINELPYPENVVIHTIAGAHNRGVFEAIPAERKVLILGYKRKNRGETFHERFTPLIEKNLTNLREDMPKWLKKFKVLSFDNLALSQCDVRSIIEPDFWTQHYMGDDGNFTMYINMVDKYFARDSVSVCHFPITSGPVEEFFNTY